MSATHHEQAAHAFQEFLKAIEKLRDPEGGCPWDLKQTFESLKPHLIEEAYEIGDAVDEGPAKICEELGDLLSVIALYAQIGRENAHFSFESVIQGITDKLIRRHPHVFGDTKISGIQDVLENWEIIKQRERAESSTPSSTTSSGLLDGLPRSMPALLRAHEIGERCARVGFDWSSANGVAEKVREELQEFLAELPSSSEPNQLEQSQQAQIGAEVGAKVIEEFGDLLFTLAQQSRHLGFSAEQSLAAANAKFIKRFKLLEGIIASEFSTQKMQDLSAEQLQTAWQKVKNTVP